MRKNGSILLVGAVLCGVMSIWAGPSSSEELEKKCARAGSAGCCLESVDIIKKGHFILEPKTGCPNGMTRNMLKCMDTLVWCEPSSPKFNGKANGWKGNVTGGDCKSNAECGTCGAKPFGPPGGLACMCLPELKKCGFGHPDWLH